MNDIPDDDILNALELMKGMSCLKQPEGIECKRLVKDNVYIAYCNVCNVEMRLSTTYTGKYPLCYEHRDPNTRPERHKQERPKQERHKQERPKQERPKQ